MAIVCYRSMGKKMWKTPDSKTSCLAFSYHYGFDKTGSSTTGIAANLLRRRFLGIDQEKDYLEISKHRREELDNSHIVYEYRSKIKDIKLMNSQCPYVVNDDIDVSYRDLPF